MPDHRILGRSLPARLGWGAASMAAVAVWIGLGGTLWARLQSREQAQEHLGVEFVLRAAETTRAIERRILADQEVLAGAVGLFDASTEVRRAEFQRFFSALHLKHRLPGMVALGWAPWVPAGEVAAFVDEMHADGAPAYPDLAVHAGAAVVPIALLEPCPDDRCAQALGWDLWSVPARRAALARARDEGDAALSSRVEVVGGLRPPEEPAYLLAMPVYRGGGIPAGVEERCAALRGWVYAAYTFREVLDSLLDEPHGELDVEVFDGAEVEGASLVYDRDGIPREAGSPAPWLQDVRRLELAGHTWTVLVHSLPAFDARRDARAPRRVLVVGLVMTALFGGLVWDLASSRRRAGRLAQAMTRELRASEERYRKLFGGSRVPMLVIDPADGRIVDANPAAEAWYGYEPARLRAMSITEINTLAPEEVRAEMERARLDAKTHFDFRHRRASGEVRDVEVSSGPIEIDGRTLLLSVVLDVHERKRMETELRDLATTDPLTGVANRRRFLGRLEEELARCRRLPDMRASVIMLDLDWFKRVNDHWGHATGDDVLRHFAALVGAELRSVDLVGRLGGEEFAALLVDADDAAAVVFAERVRARLAETPYLRGDQPVRVTVSVGVTRLRATDGTADATLARADTALYRAKAAGRDRVEVAA